MSASGTLAAAAVGMLVLCGGGWEGGGVLAAFFISSNLVSRGSPRPTGLDPKGERRDAGQVLANGGAAAAAALVGLADPALGVWLVTAALAAAGADTWATSVGTRSRSRPRLLLGGGQVPSGTSGGVTPLGTAGGALGAMLVAAVGAWVTGWAILFPVASLIGFGGMLLDSVLGAAVQGRFRCPSCAQPSEWRIHRCGSRTVHEGGVAWLNNDGVNLAASAFAGAAAWAVWVWLCPCS